MRSILQASKVESMRRFLAILLLLVLVTVAVPLVARRANWGPNPSARARGGQSVSIGAGRSLSVSDTGTGKPIVLVHGLASNASDWGELPARLAAAGHRVIHYDRIGYGYSTRSEPGASNYTYASNATDLRALLNALGIERAALVGWSFGGGVVQTFALESPERVTQLALIASTGPVHRPATGSLARIVKSPLGPHAMRWAASIPFLRRRLVHDDVLRAFGRERDIPALWIEYREAMLAMPGTLRTISLEFRRADPQQLRPDAIQTPTLVVHGTDDLRIPHVVAEDLARRLPNSALQTVLEGGHMLPITHPDLLAEKLHELVGSEYREGRLPVAGMTIQTSAAARSTPASGPRP